MSSPSPEIVVAGAGPMAEEHVRALLAAGVAADRILVVGRGRERAEALAARHGVQARWGAGALGAETAPVAIVAVTETELAPTAAALAGLGAHHVLVEKPGALGVQALAALEDVDADVFVAYNRRFYPSVAAARRLVEEDGGPVSLAFDFTEVESRVLDDAERRGLGPEILARWGLANSLHVIDLAFHLGGDPVELDVRRAGSLPWHPSGATFAGSGRTGDGALFAYGAAWDGAGRWSVEVTTRRRKLVLRPLEELQEQLRGSFALEPVALPGEPAGVKPGLAGQLAAFLSVAGGAPADPALCPLPAAVERLRTASRMLGYDS